MGLPQPGPRRRITLGCTLRPAVPRRQLSTAAQLVLPPPLRAPGSSPRLALPCPGHGVEVTARSEEQRLPARSLGEA